MFANRTLALLKRVRLFATCLAFTCASTSGAQDDNSYPDLSQLSPETVVAVVNGNPINFAQVEYAYTLLPAELTALPLAQILPQVVQLVIEQRLLAEEAVKQSLHEDVAYKAALQFQADRLLQETVIAQMMADQLTDEALEIAYTVYSMQLPLEERVRARHILIAPGSNDEADVRDALVEAQDLIRQLNEGADFAELALEFSDDTGSAEQGGDLGFFPRGRMVEPFEDAAFALELNAFTQEAVASPFGFHIIEVLERTEMKPTLDEVREELMTQLETQRLSIKLSELRAGAEIMTIIESADGGN
jgi:peptidyl-prolyl cis-trans isomerase C